MKRIVSALILLSMLLSVTACSNARTTATPETHLFTSIDTSAVTDEADISESSSLMESELPEWSDDGYSFDIDFRTYFHDAGYHLIEGDGFDTNDVLNLILNQMNFAIALFQNEGNQPLFNTDYLAVNFYPDYESPLAHQAFCVEIMTQSASTGEYYKYQILFYTNYDGGAKSVELANSDNCNAIMLAEIGGYGYLVYYYGQITGDVMSISKYENYHAIDNSEILEACQYDFSTCELTTLDPSSMPEHDFAFFDPTYGDPDSFVTTAPDYGNATIEGADEYGSDSGGSAYRDDSFYALEAIGGKISNNTCSIGGEFLIYMSTFGYWISSISVDGYQGTLNLRSYDGIIYTCATSGDYYKSVWEITSEGFLYLGYENE